jgi:hypothetical protein
MEFKVGDIVKIEGVLERNPDITSKYPLLLRVVGFDRTFTKDGKHTLSDSTPTLQLVNRPEQKIKKYRVLYQHTEHGCLSISNIYYENEKDFNKMNKLSLKFIHLILETEKEFEE